jgi:hypothetical protein
MMAWFRQLFRRGTADETDETPSPWALELTDLLQKTARAQARLGVRLESMESKLEGGFADLRSIVESPNATRDAGDPLPWEELFDAADALDAAAALVGQQGNPELAGGLTAVRRRIEVFLDAGGFERITALDRTWDGKLFRVVAEVDDEGSERLVRAAIRRADAVFREGEVVTPRKKVEHAGDIRD